MKRQLLDSAQLEANLIAMTDAINDTLLHFYQLNLPFARAALRPVRDTAEIGVDRYAVEPRPVVVQLVAVFERALHGHEHCHGRPRGPQRDSLHVLPGQRREVGRANRS